MLTPHFDFPSQHSYETNNSTVLYSKMIFIFQEFNDFNSFMIIIKMNFKNMNFHLHQYFLH